MTIPASILAVQGVGWAQTVWLTTAWLKQLHSMPTPDATSAPNGDAFYLLVYRLACLAYCLFIGIRQLALRGPHALFFFTVWNWWLLTVFFALGAYASWIARRRGSKLRRLQLALTAMFHTEAPSTIIVDSITWLVLVPMLMKDPDPERRAIYIDRLFCLESYSQHGVNFFMMAGELALNQIPSGFYVAGWQGVWGSVYGVWSAVFYLMHGRPLYPFLDVKRPHAWIGFAAVFLLSWMAFGMVQLGILARNKARSRRKQLLHPRKVA